MLVAFRPHVSLLPPPTLVAREFWTLAASGELFTHIMASLSRVFSAWCLAGLTAIPLGLAMGRIPRFERIVDPLIELVRPISPLAWIPLAILWFGIGEFGKIFVVLVGTFFPTLISTVAGVKRIDPVLIHAGQVLGCTDRMSLFRKVVLPAALPNIITGLRISFGTGWAAIIAAELVAARSGLGYLISNGMEILRADKVLVGMVVIGILGVSFRFVLPVHPGKIAGGRVREAGKPISIRVSQRPTPPRPVRRSRRSLRSHWTSPRVSFSRWWAVWLRQEHASQHSCRAPGADDGRGSRLWRTHSPGRTSTGAWCSRAMRYFPGSLSPAMSSSASSARACRARSAG